MRTPLSPVNIAHPRRDQVRGERCGACSRACSPTSAVWPEVAHLSGRLSNLRHELRLLLEALQVGRRRRLHVGFRRSRRQRQSLSPGQRGLLTGRQRMSDCSTKLGTGRGHARHTTLPRVDCRMLRRVHGYRNHKNRKEHVVDGAPGSLVGIDVSRVRRASVRTGGPAPFAARQPVGMEVARHADDGLAPHIGT